MSLGLVNTTIVLSVSFKTSSCFRTRPMLGCCSVPVASENSNATHTNRTREKIRMRRPYAPHHNSPSGFGRIAAPITLSARPVGLSRASCVDGSGQVFLGRWHRLSTDTLWPWASLSWLCGPRRSCCSFEPQEDDPASVDCSGGIAAPSWTQTWPPRSPAQQYTTAYRPSSCALLAAFIPGVCVVSVGSTFGVVDCSGAVFPQPISRVMDNEARQQMSLIGLNITHRS